MKTKTIGMAITLAIVCSALFCIAQTTNQQPRAWTFREKATIGYTLPRTLISSDEVQANPIAQSLLMQGIAVGIAIGRGSTTNAVPYELLLEGVNLWAESRKAYMDALTNR